MTALDIAKALKERSFEQLSIGMKYVECGFRNLSLSLSSACSHIKRFISLRIVRRVWSQEQFLPAINEIKKLNYNKYVRECVEQ